MILILLLESSFLSRILNFHFSAQSFGPKPVKMGCLPTVRESGRKTSCQNLWVGDATPYSIKIGNANRGRRTKILVSLDTLHLKIKPKMWSNKFFSKSLKIKFVLSFNLIIDYIRLIFYCTPCLDMQKYLSYTLPFTAPEKFKLI